MAAFADRVRAGARVVGTFLKLPGLEPVDLVARAGFDFAVVDLEHSQLELGEALRIVRHGAVTGLPVVVRTPSLDGGLVNRVLEAGADGIQLSTVRTAAAARSLRSALRYPPEGTRSVSSAHPAADYGRIPLARYLADAAASPPLVVGQIETARTEDPLPEVLAHLDVAFLGTTDLSVDLGEPGDLSHPAVAGRMAEVAEAAARAGVALGGFAPGGEGARMLWARGASYVVVGSDLQALRHGLEAHTVPAPDVPAPDVPAPDVPAPDVPAPAVPSEVPGGERA